MKQISIPILSAALTIASTGAAQAAEGTFTTHTLTTEAALGAAQGALAFCRKQGYQVSVSVTDRSGVPIALLRDRYAGVHTADTATRKAYTAANFHMDTASLAKATEAGDASGIRHVDRILALGGGLPVESSGSLVGAIGVSGAPGPDKDAACAKAGVDAIQDLLNF